MYLRHNNLLFIHIPKTGGQSIASFLMDLYGYEWADRWLFGMVRNETPRLGPPQVAHFTLDEYIHSVYWPYDVIENAVKFCVVRNPWDRLWSEYNFNWKNRISWDGFFDLFPHYIKDDFQTGLDFGRHIMPQVDFIDDRVEILRFERLEEDFTAFCEKHGIPKEEPLLKMNSIKSKSYLEVYDAKKIDAVRNFYESDIEKFNYEFGD